MKRCSIGQQLVRKGSKGEVESDVLYCNKMKFTLVYQGHKHFSNYLH